jgi:hypothetical protein
MSELVCQNLEAAQRYEAGVGERVWSALREAGCWKERRASAGDPITVRFDPEMLHAEGREHALGVVLGTVANHPCVQQADVLTYATGEQQRLVRMLGGLLGKTVVDVEHNPRSSNPNSFIFASDQDQERAYAAQHPCIIEGDVSYLGSASNVPYLFTSGQRPHSVALLLRSSEEPEYPPSIAHYLVRQDIDLRITSPEFYESFGFWPRHAPRRPTIS